MSLYAQIKNPETGINVSIYGKLGQKVLANYLNVYQYGGSEIPLLLTNVSHVERMASHLYHASSQGDSAKVEHLLNTGADLSSKEMRALMVACRKGHLDVVRVLLESDADVVNEIDEYDGMTALMWACSYGHLEVVELLLEYDADVNKVYEAEDDEVFDDGYNEAYTALHCACMNGHLEVAKLLLKKGADVNAISPASGWTALMTTCIGVSRADEATRGEVLKFLLIIGANPLLESEQDGYTALIIAEEYRQSRPFAYNLLKPVVDLYTRFTDAMTTNAVITLLNDLNDPRALVGGMSGITKLSVIVLAKAKRVEWVRNKTPKLWTKDCAKALGRLLRAIP